MKNQEVDNLIAETVHKRGRTSVESPELTKKRLNFEVRLILEGLSAYAGVVGPEEIPSVVALWLALRTSADIPDRDYEKEANHNFGPVNTFVTGAIKSYEFGQPMLEVHCTACPSYLDSDSLDKHAETGLYIHQVINDHKVSKFKEYIAGIGQVGDRCMAKIVLHTPCPADLGGEPATLEFASCFGIFNMGQDGFRSAEYHWSQMERITSSIPGLELAPDLGYVSKFIGNNQARYLLDHNESVRNAYKKFAASSYINDAYVRWGADPVAVFSGFYLGSVMAYGNSEATFNPSNHLPLKLYICFEEGDSPETFTGKRTKVDVRHLLSDEGQHLALLTAHYGLRTPWAMKG